MAPEVLAGKSYDCAADVFSFGIILWELLTWRIPWEDLGPWQVHMSSTINCAATCTAARCYQGSGWDALHFASLLFFLEGEGLENTPQARKHICAHRL